MKSSIHISTPVLAIVLLFWLVAMGHFATNWFGNRAALKQMAKEETELREQLVQLSIWGKWTLDYVKIDKAVDFLSENRLSKSQKRMLSEQIWGISRSYAIDPLLILAVVSQESRGNPNARGKLQSGAFSGALGLMQVKLETAKMMGAHFGLKVETEADLLKPEINVVVGTAYLIKLIARYGNWKNALIAYNIGHSAVDRMLQSGIPLPTSYYEHVISRYNELTKISFL